MSLKITDEPKLDFDDVLIRPKRTELTSRRDVDITREFTFRHSKRTYKGIPIMASNMDGVGTFSMAHALSKYDMFTVIRKHYTPDDWDMAVSKGLVSFDNVAVCTGSNAIHDPNAADYSNLKAVIRRHPKIKYICIDVANGYQECFADFVSRVREEFPHQVLIAGNVVTFEMTEQLLLSGADIVKVGIGPGSVCTTRIKTGVGYPQLSAIAECIDAAHGMKGHVIADGGCREAGDVAKAFGAGADFVMLGGMFAFHEESEEVDENGMVKFYGMSSDDAMQRHGTRKDGYRGAEGKTVLMPCRGPVSNTVEDLLGNLRSACSYVGAERLKELHRRTTFVRVNRTHNTVF